MWFLGLIVLQIIATADSQYWSGCSGVIFPPDEHVNCVSTDTATETSSETKMRCFCLHKPPSMNSQDQPDWAKSDKDCSKKYRGGRLAMDDREDVHRILTAMVITHCAEAWIGGKAVPWHWNWLPTLENKIRQQMSYQGCCVVPGKVDAVSRHNYTSTNNLQGNCNKKCLEHCTTYFTLEKKIPFLECACYEWNKIEPAQCKRGECQPCNNGWCGSTQKSKAVYLTNAKAYYGKWNWGHPTKGGNCLAFARQWSSVSCGATTDITDSVYCVKENSSTCEQHDAEWRGQETGKCFKRMQLHSRTHQASVEQCEKYGMSLLSITSKQMQEDAEYLYNNDLIQGRQWTAGTNLRWQWQTGSDIYDGFTAWPNQREQFAFEDMCLAITESGLWNSSSCETSKTYICETVVDRKNVTFYSTTLAPVTTDIPSSGDLRTKAKGTRCETTTSKPVPTTRSSSDRQRTETTDSGNDSSSTMMTGVIIGAATGGCLLLLILILIALFLIRRRRQEKEVDKTLMNNFKTGKGHVNQDYYNIPNNYVNSSNNGKLDKNNHAYVNRESAKSSSSVNMSTINGNLYEHSSSSGINKNRNSKNIDMVDNDLYNSTDSDEPVYNMIDDDDMNSEETLNAVRKTTVDSDLCAVSDTQKNKSPPDYNLTEPGQMGRNKSTEAVMIDNDIYVSKEDNTNDLLSVDIMVDNDIYNSSDDDMNDEKVGIQGRPHAGTPKPPNTPQPKAGYELASPIPQINIK